jgi:hypothetical protein
MLTIGLSCVLLASPSLPPTPKLDDQSYLAILAETHEMRMAGAKQIKMPKLPPGFKLPAGVSLPGQPSRSLSVRLWSPSIAPDSATASLAIPSGLQLGDKLDLDLYRPTPEENTGGGGGGGSRGSSTPPDFTIKFYWGSSPTVQAGQPKVIKLADLAPEQMMEMSKRQRESTPMQRGGAGGSFFYKPNWTTGHWPGSTGGSEITENASLTGSYKLTTNYTGSVAIDVPAGVDFLAPIDMTSPDLSQKVPMDQAMNFQWSAIPNALGSNASIIGMVGQNTMIIWSSSESFNNNLMADTNYLQMDEVRQRVADHLFMGPSTTSVTVPAGIFGDADFASMTMIAYGPGTALDKTQPIPRVQTKSTLQIMLGGKKMKGN